MTTQDILILCMLSNFSCFCCRLLTFSKLAVSKKFRNTSISVSKGFDPDQDLPILSPGKIDWGNPGPFHQHSVGLDLGPNCLQRLSADDKSHG